MSEPAMRAGGSVYAVPLPGQWLLHAPLHKTTALCDELLIADLAERPRLPAAAGRLGELCAALRRQPLVPPPARTGPLCPEFLGLVPTRACNMACRYCGFGSAPSGHPTMSEALAVQAVDWMGALVRAQGGLSLAVDFFGGEPMVAGHVVRAAVRRAQAIAGRYGMTTRFEVATNGCFGDALCRFVRENFDHVMLSLDGPPEIQDLHRPLHDGEGSSALVAHTARALGGGRASLCIRMCVTGESVRRLAADVAWVCRTFRPASVHVEPLRPTARSVRAGLTPPDAWLLVRAMHEAGRSAKAAGVRLVCASAQIDRLVTVFCPLGKDVPIVDAEGRVTACYLQAEDWQAAGLDLSLGRMEPGASAPAFREEAVDRVRALSRPPRECASCFSRWHCAGGCVVNMHGSGRKDAGDEFCIRTRLLCALALLEELGRPDLADKLLADREAMERLAWRRSDVVDIPWEAMP